MTEWIYSIKIRRPRQKIQSCNSFAIRFLKHLPKRRRKRKPNPELMFEDVYKELPLHLQRQLEEMKRHVSQHAEHYPMDTFERMK